MATAARKALVLDASAALQAIIPDSNLHREHAELLLARIVAGRTLAHVPVIFFNEIAVGCSKGVKTRRLSRGDADEFLHTLSLVQLELTIEVIPAGVWLDRALRWDCQVADSAYLQLALDQRLPLATTDKSLTAAALRQGVEVIAPKTTT